ncbi:MAG: hypothetical protein E4G95_04680 [Bacteroidia bacterium]|nr:MAG: hypothetical protein E4G95_04680 [Bacteroidia bacterium]
MKKLLFIVVLTSGMFWLALGQNDETELYSVSDTIKDFGLFKNEEILELSLRFDITTYRRKKPKDDYLDAVLTYHISATDSINRSLKLKSRGEFRNEYCDFPPIQLNFKKGDFERDDLQGLNKVKLVTHCQTGNENGLFKEYLIYKLYNVLTDTSFRVRLVRINYINTFKDTKPVRSYAFFIEPLDFLAERINAVPVEATNLGQVNIVPEMMDRMAIFNYMVGNTDWSVPNQHNCKVLVQPGSENSNLGLVAPYDFDYSGFVNASYAIPAEGLGIERVTQRIYQGICRDEEVFRDALKEFETKKESFYNVILDFPYMDERTKSQMIKFLDEFYNDFDSKNSIVRHLVIECKNL